VRHEDIIFITDTSVDVLAQHGEAKSRGAT
jgi:hypothetical protein